MRNLEPSALRSKLEPPWDDLRERRVLQGLLEKHRRGQKPRRRVWVWALAPAAVVLALVFWGSRTWIHSAAVAVSATAAGQSTLALADGSTAILAAEAAVQIEDQQADRVHLVQSRGSVRYEVRPDPSRDFVVRAADTIVRVRGTVFTVDMQDGSLQVAVQRGRVEVTHAGMTHDLVVGESLRVPIGTSDAPAEVAATADNQPPLAPSSSSDPSSARATDSSVPTDVPTAATLEAQADAARVAGDNGQAVAALERLVALHPRDPRVPNALFTLGRVQRARGMTGASARAFERCFAAAPGGPLAQDALAEAAQAWSNAGNDDAAQQDANTYLKRWPLGASATQMRTISGK
jgi:transmembrane sensor